MLQAYILGMCKLRCSYSLKQLTDREGCAGFLPLRLQSLLRRREKGGMEIVSEITSCWLVIGTPIFFLPAPGECPGQGHGGCEVVHSVIYLLSCGSMGKNYFLSAWQ